MPTNTPSLLEIRPKFAQIFAKLFFAKPFVIEIWVNYYFCLCKGAAVTTGMAFAQRFVDRAVVDVLIVYFTETWKRNNLQKAVGTANLLDGLSSVLVIPMIYISLNHVGPLKVILYSTAAYIIGMVMFCTSYYFDKKIPDNKKEMYFTLAVLLIAVGQSGGLPVLKEFLYRQLMAHEPRLDKDEGRVKGRRTVWWTASFLGAVLTPLIFGNASWGVIFISSTSVLGVGYLLFLCCIPLYHSPEEKKNNGPAVSAISLVKQLKPLSIMIPMWTTFLVFGLVLSAGFTFFTAQASTLKLFGKNNSNMDPTVSIYILIMIGNIISSTPGFSRFTFRLISSSAFGLITSSTLSTLQAKCIRKLLKKKGIIITICTAMMLSVFCCGVAWRVEVHRLHAIEKADDSGDIPMSIMWLTPQFCLLGLMLGIATLGLDLFFEDQVSDVPMKNYGSELNGAVIGIGSFLNGLLVVLSRSWFTDDLNTSRLDKYYLLLTVVSFVNLCYYCCVSIFYLNKKETKDDVKVEETGVGAV